MRLLGQLQGSRKKNSVIKAGLCMGVIFFLVCLSHITVADDSIKIFGYAKDLSDNPVEAYVGINDENWNSIQGVETDASGYYEISVPRHSAYNFWIDSWVQNGDYRVEAYIPQTKTVETQSNEDALEVNFTLKPGGSIIVFFYNDNGSLLRNTSFRNLVLGNNWVTTLDGLPTDGVLNIAFDKECGGDWQNALPAFIVPLNEPLSIHILYEVPGFGKVIVTADNEGRGYKINQQSDFIEINLNYEIAKSKLASLKRDYNNLIYEGCNIPSYIKDGIDRAEAYLQEGKGYLSGNQSKMGKAIQNFDNSVREAYFTLVKLRSERQRCSIEKYRKGNAYIFVVDEAGNPLPGLPVSVTQTRHSFLFGCNAYMLGRFSTPEENRLYEEQFAALFNYATLPFYWSSFEPQPGVKNFPRLEYMAQWCCSNGILPKGHPLIWHQSVPEWAPQDINVLEEQLQARVREIVDHFRETINMWDVINESTVSSDFDNPVGRWVKSIGAVTAASRALQWAHESNPDALLLVNDFNISHEYEDQLQKLLEQGVPLHATGIQSHMHTGTWPLDRVWEVCETYGHFGIPIHFTEVTVLSGALKTDDDWDSYHPDWDTTPEGEASQAEYVEALYRLLFSHPMVQAITWWDFSDQGAWQAAPAGLVRKDLSPKPVYDRLLALIKGEWWTSLNGQSNDQGIFFFTGFAGDYDIEVEFPEGVRTYSAHLYEQKSVSYRISPSSIIVETIPDIKANGSDGPITLNQSDTITVTVALDNNGITDNADWWLAAGTPFSLFFYTFEGWTTDWVPAYQGQLFYLDSFEVLNIPLLGLPAGTYTFYFAVDTYMDGNVTWDSVYYDTVEVNITE